MADKLIQLEGLTAENLYTKMRDMGVTKAEAGALVAGWIYENYGSIRRTFNYHESFPAAEPACTPGPFVRKFVHQDWLDGEDVVQAGATPGGDEGFNSRMHKIEADTDELARRLGQLTACQAAMRASLAKILDEVRAEINRLNSDVFDCCQKSASPSYTIPNYAGLVEKGVFMGTTKMMDKYVTLWQTKQGLMMLPAIEQVGVDMVGNPRATSPGLVAKFVEDHREVREVFRQEVPVGKLRDRFGKEQLADGTLLEDALEVLPLDRTFASLDAMVDEIADRNAAALRTTMGAKGAIGSALGIEDVGADIAKASIEGMSTIPGKARAALLKNGVETLGELARLEPERAQRMMEAEGVAATKGDVAGWRANAATLAGLGRRG